MPNARIANTFLNVSGFSATSTASNFSIDNVVDLVSPQKHWRSTVTTDSRYVLDLGTTQTTITVHMDWVNFNSFKFQESADGSTGWTDVGTTETITIDPVHQTYRFTKTITLTTKRYLGIWIPTQTPVDGAGYFRIGSIAVPTNIVELTATTDVAFPLNFSLPETHIIQNRFPVGKVERIALGQLQPMNFSVNLSTDSEAQNIKGSAVSEIANILGQPQKLIFFDFNLGETWQAYLCHRAGSLAPTVSFPASGEVSWGTLGFEVVT